MNKKGFIATSLIYSFFLVFVTLFLVIIADYLQNKVLLNTIEKGIKDELNTSIGILDLEVGQIFTFDRDLTIDGVPFGIDSTWILAGIDYNNKDIVLYNTSASEIECDTYNENDYVSESNIKADLLISNDLNPNRVDEILNNFEGEQYSIKNKEAEIIQITKDCSKISVDINGDVTIDYDSCTPTSTCNFRERKKIWIGTTKLKIATGEIGGFTVLEVV